MVDSQITLTISILFVVLFSISIIGFSIGFGNDNNAAINIANDSYISNYYTDSKDNLSTFKDNSESTYSSIVETTVEPGSDSPKTMGSFAITPGNLMGVAVNTIRLPYKYIFGNDSGFGIFVTTFIAFLLFIMGLLLYKTLRGSP